MSQDVTILETQIIYTLLKKTLRVVGVSHPWTKYGCGCMVLRKLLVFVAVFGFSLAVAWGEVITVGSGGNFSTIQEAVTYASPYDTILVMPGVYYENLHLTKPLNLSAPQGATVIPGDQYLPVLHLQGVSGVNVSGFTLRYAETGGAGAPGVPGMLGIYIESASGNLLRDVSVVDFPTGVILNSSTGNVLEGVRVLSATWNSIYLENSSSNTLVDVVAKGSARAHGVVLRLSTGNTFINLTASDNSGHGVLLESSGSNAFYGGEAVNNTFGFFLQGSSGNVIAGMNISLNYAENLRFEESSYNTLEDSVIYSSVTENGIYLNESHYNTLSNLSIARNRWNGVYINASRGTKVVGCDIYANEPAGVYILNSPESVVSGSRVHHNLWRGVYVVASDGVRVENSSIYANQEGVYFELSTGVRVVNNTLDSNLLYGIRARSSGAATIALNTVSNTTANPWAKGVELSSVTGSVVYHNAFINNSIQAWDDSGNAWDYAGGGNYWSDYDTQAEGCYDSDLNRRCDSPYAVPPNASDRYPYTKPYLWLGVPRIAGAVASPSEPTVGGTVNLTFTLLNPGSADFSGRVEGSAWLPDGTGRYLGIKSVFIPAGGSLNVTFPHTVSQGGSHDYDLYLEPQNGNWLTAIDHVYVQDGFRGRGTQVLSEGFGAPPDWSTLRWRFTGGEYVGTAEGASVAYLPGYSGTDFTYTAEMRLYSANATLSGTAGVVFRYRDESNYYLLTAYPTLSLLRLWSVVNGTWYLLNETQYTFTPGASYLLEVSLSGSRVVARVNSTPLLTFSALSSHPSGSVGLRVRDASAGFGWVRIQDASGMRYESFSPPSLGWCTLRWCTSGGAYSSTAYEFSTISFSPSPAVANLTYEVRLRILGGKQWTNPTAGVVFRYRDESNYYLFTLYPESNLTRLWSVVNGTWYLLDEAQHPLEYGRSYVLRVEVAGARVRAYLDGRRVLGFSALSSHPSGRLGVRIRNAAAEYDYATAESW